MNEGLGNLSICRKLNDMGVLNPTGYKKKKLNQNYSNSKIIEQDFLWCPSTIRNILKNDIYIGNITQGKRKVKSYKIHKIEQVPENEWIRKENMHEAIIDKKLFDKAQNLRKVDTRVQNNGKLSIWAGILRCGDCKRAMHKKYCKNKTGKIYEYYVCSTYRKKSNNLCTKHTIKIDDLENAVLTAIRMCIESLSDIEKILQDAKKYNKIKGLDQEIQNIKISKQKDIEKIDNLKRYLYEDFRNELITKEEYLAYKRKYEQKIKNAKEIINNLDRQKQEQENNINEKNEWIEQFKVNKNIISLDRDVIVELIDYIEIYENNKIRIYFKFTC